MNLRKNNKGFSLVELIVAFAIFAIVGIAICGFVSFCSKNYGTANKNVKLQYEQQIVVNRLRDIVLETSRGISYDSSTSTLIVLSDNQGSDKEAHPFAVTKIEYDAANTSLYITEENIAQVDSIDKVVLTKSRSLLSDSVESTNASVKAFDVHLDEVDVGRVTLDITFKVGTKEVTVHPVIALRNMIKKVDATTNLEDVYDGEVEEFFSKVASVVITRDGKQFTGGRTDTIAMAGDRTVVDYDAIVTKKSTVKEEISKSVTWEIDLTTIKEAYKDTYQSYISLDADGRVTVNNVTVDGKVIGPNDVINGNYFIIKAISTEDPTKMAKLRVKVTTDGVYPVSITTDGISEGGYQGEYAKDASNGVVIYTFSHSITYTAPIADPTQNNTKVNPLTGAGAYTKISYSVFSDAGLTQPAAIPAGAGFTKSGKVDGKFIVVKSMEEKTYYIVATVDQKNKDGEIVKDVFTLTIPKDIIPVISDETVPQLNAPKTANRGELTPLSMTWSKGVPTYEVTENGVTKNKQYNYWIEYTISPAKDSSWIEDDSKNGLKTAFYSDKTVTYKYNSVKLHNVYFTTNGYDDKGTSVTNEQTKRIANFYVQPYVDWSKKFVIDVKMKVKVSKNGDLGSATYYRLKDSDVDYEQTAQIVIDPVSLTLAPASDSVQYYYNKNPLAQYYGSAPIIHMGKRYGTTDFNQLPKDGMNRVQYRYYYKFFVPTFTGISVDIFNYGTNVKSIKTTLSNGNSAFVPYYKSGNSYDYSNKNTKGFESKIVNMQNNLYVYLMVHPEEFEAADKFPVGCRWQCIVEDEAGNSIQAQFTQSGSDFINYTLHHYYEGECDICKNGN